MKGLNLFYTTMTFVLILLILAVSPLGDMTIPEIWGAITK